MAKADYICCDRCDCKVVYDAEDTIKDGLQALGLGDTPILCKDCRATPPALSSPAPAVPMGWKLVPIIPSTDMAIIGGDLIEAGGSDLCSENVYAAMLKAAPPAPVAAHTAMQEEALTDALTEVMEWIDNWSPPFTNDDEWPETAKKVRAALAAARTKEG